MRDVYLKKPKYSSLTQGSIVRGCVATNYPDSEVWGCIITARCDLSNEKVKTVHYLPIVSFDDWLKNELVDKIRIAWSAALKSKLGDKLKMKKISPSFVDRQLSREDFEKIIRSHFKGKEYQTIMSDYDKWVSSSSCSLKDILSDAIGEGILKSEVNRLIKHDYRSFYLIEDWDPSDVNPGYKVILLHDIKVISLECALQLPDGILENDLSVEDCKNNALAFSEDKSHLYYVDSEIKSPFIEHIIQRFVTNFSRI